MKGIFSTAIGLLALLRCLESVNELTGSDDWYLLKAMHLKEVFVPRHDNVCLSFKGASEDVVVIGISAYRHYSFRLYNHCT